LSFCGVIITLQLEMKTQFLNYLSDYLFGESIFLFKDEGSCLIFTEQQFSIWILRKKCWFHFQIRSSDKSSVITMHTSAFVCPVPVNQI